MGFGSATARGSAEAAAWDGGHGWAVAQDLMFVEASGVVRRSGLWSPLWRGVAVLMLACTEGRLPPFLARGGFRGDVISEDAADLPLLGSVFHGTEDQGR